MSDDTRQKILEAASEAFIERGYRVSLDEIARHAGVAKQTVYHYFPSKDELFACAVETMGEDILVALSPLEGEALPDTLARFALALRERVLGASCIALHRLLIAEAPRFPQLARTVYEAGIGETVRRLSTLLGRAMDEGRLRRDDPRLAAELLLEMLIGAERNRCLYEVQRPGGVPAAEAAPHIVSIFLRAYHPEKPIESTLSPSPPRSTTP
ncbi:TetR/AcrR family transcriptional regulator [Tepidiphilus succinatimandens]|uniref:TetR/AcrR family transcriptional regulator n=1 Tax=Tepidiphilus succinatimandens TaxID=224436 RepID=UPI00112F6B59|nr:TetR/AcrR family transcriptional regulator [Tepidiphilus succinatimandens]